jgi:hypothetical protein
MSAMRNDNGIVVDSWDPDLSTPASEILVMDAGDNVIARGTPDQLEVFERIYGSRLRSGVYTLIALTQRGQS